ncbi:MAG: hypothetical protein EOO31_02380 [Comamonadaceae bacterium]|nr:MAG: hypothetical protein EOO31_02380 [Comamonadaceae bacterium]
MPFSLRARSRARSRISTRAAYVALCLLSAWSAAHADYLWLEPASGGGLQVRSGSLDKPDTAAPALKEGRAFLHDGKELQALPEGTGVSISAPGQGDVRYSAVEVGEGKTVTLYHARFGRAGTKAASDLELVPTEPGGQVFKLVWKGRPVAASQVQVETAAGWRRVLKPGTDGTVRMETPFPGLYVLEVTARVNGSVVVDGVKYEDVRHTATLSFEVSR